MSHIWMSHVTRMNKSCHTHESVMSHIWMSHVCHIWMSHAAHLKNLLATRYTISYIYLNESRHTSEWVTAHIWMSHGTHLNESYRTHMNESCRTSEWVMSNTYEWVMSHIWKVCSLKNIPYLFECVMSHIWMNHVTHLNESCHTHKHMWVSHVAHLKSRLAPQYTISNGPSSWLLRISTRFTLLCLKVRYFQSSDRVHCVVK